MTENRKNIFARRLSKKIVIHMTVLLTIVVIFTELYSAFIVTNLSEQSASNMLKSTIMEIENSLKPVQVVGNNTAWLAGYSLQDRDGLYMILKQVIESNPEVCGCAVALRPDFYEGIHLCSPYACRDSLGNTVTKDLAADGHEYIYDDWFQIPQYLKEPVWSEPYYDEGGAEILMSTYSIPLLDDEGELLAVVTADVSLDWLSDKLASMKPFAKSQTMLISKLGSFVAADKISLLAGETIYSLAYRAENKDEILDICSKLLSGNSGTIKTGKSKDKSFIVYGQLSNGWTLYINSWYRDVMEKSNRMYLVLTILGFLALISMFFFAYRIISRYSKPIQDFSDAAIKISNGDFNVFLPEIKTDDEIKTLRDSFDHMQLSLNNYIDELQTTTASKERMASELNIGHAIQQSMLPTNFPHRDNLDVYAQVIPAREVGGDLYDFGTKGNDDILFIVGDVSGKGVPAAMFMAIVGSAFRFTSSLGLSMEEKITRINDGVSQANISGMFVTLFAGKMDLKTGEMVYCNCGHNPAVIVEPDKDPYFLPQIPNMAIGVWESFPYKEQRIVLPKGTRLIFYTDGVTEAEAADKSQYGEERLLQWAATIPQDADSQTANESLLASVREFTNGNEQNDDITIMIIKI